jgi:hypothetical protein
MRSGLKNRLDFLVLERVENLARFSNMTKAAFVSLMSSKSGKEALNLFYT